MPSPRMIGTRRRGDSRGEAGRGSFYQDLFVLEKKITKVDKQEQQLR